MRIARPLELLCAYAATMWGIWLLLPGATFTSSAVFRILSQMMPEDTWGVLAIAIGSLQLGGWLGHVWLLRILAAVTAMIFWAVLMTTYLLGLFNSTGGPIYSMFVLAETLILIYVIRDWSAQR